MRFGVVVFPGTWSDCAFHYVSSEVLHEPVKYVWHRERSLEGLDCVILPGGFSYGDYLRAGAVAGRSPIVDALRGLVAGGGPGAGAGDGLPNPVQGGGPRRRPAAPGLGGRPPPPRPRSGARGPSSPGPSPPPSSSRTWTRRSRAGSGR